MKSMQTIRWQLFFRYATIITVVVLLIAAAVYVYVSDILEQKASESLQTVATNISISLDAEFQQMNEEANRVISSVPIKEFFYTSDPGLDNHPPTRNYLFSLLFTVSGSSMNHQINIMGENGRLIQYGRLFDITRQAPGEVFSRELFVRCLAEEGRKDISGVHSNAGGQQVVSLSRAFGSSFGAAYDSIVEVQQYYSKFEQLISQAVSSAPVARPRVYNTYGEQIYPAQPKAEYYDAVKDSPDEYGTLHLSAQGNEDSEILSFTRSAQTGWTVVVGQSEREMLRPVTLFRNLVFVVVLLVLLATQIASFFIARQLTQPIQRIQESIAQLNLTALSSPGLPGDLGALSELEVLYNAYAEMVERLQASLEDIVSIRSHEIQARMLALQAQINPHFLYNTITNISVLADMHGREDIVKMCESLSGMLRYTVQDISSPTTVAAEVAHMRQYLYLMECRYPEQIEVAMDIAPEMLAVRVPKLILQPIMENCFKYAFHNRPPWRIAVKGALEEGHWHISVTDNGVGFDNAVLEWLESKMREEDFHFSDSEGGQIGLLNIYYRLKILYRQDAVFQIVNHPDGGSTVLIGGVAESALLS